MDPELTALATAGATALVQQMATDGWARVRDRLARMVARGGDPGTLRDELDEARAEVSAARDAGDEDAASEVLTEWRARLRRALAARPELAAELRALLDEVAPAPPEPAGSVHNSITGGVQHGAVIQAHTLGSVTLGMAPPAPGTHG